MRFVWRAFADMRSGVRLAHRRDAEDAFAHLVCRYERPLICYEGQEASFLGKRGNGPSEHRPARDRAGRDVLVLALRRQANARARC